jgi:hypothetical protein
MLQEIGRTEFVEAPWTDKHEQLGSCAGGSWQEVARATWLELGKDWFPPTVTLSQIEEMNILFIKES